MERPGLIPADTYIKEAVHRRRQREAVDRTGVACPRCDQELMRRRPPLQSVTEMIWFLAICRKCSHTVWLPEG